MNMFQWLLWHWRVYRGIKEVIVLAKQNEGNPLYQVRDMKVAWSIFCENSSYETALSHTTDEQGEIIEMVFYDVWTFVVR